MKKGRTYRKCERFAKTLREMKYEKISFRDLKYNIKVFIGSDDRTVERYLHLLGEFGFVTPAHGHPSLFDVNEVDAKSQPTKKYFPKTIQQFLEVSDEEPP